MAFRLKAPPFSKYLSQLINNGSYPPSHHSVYIFMGRYAWKKAEGFQYSRPTTMCLPPFEPPFIYDFPVKKCAVLIFDTSESAPEEIEEFALWLFRCGAATVHYVSHEGNLTVFKKEL